jgi:hypothetical protein
MINLTKYKGINQTKPKYFHREHTGKRTVNKNAEFYAKSVFQQKLPLGIILGHCRHYLSISFTIFQIEH